MFKAPDFQKEREIEQFLDLHFGHEAYRPGLSRFEEAFLPLKKELAKKKLQVITVAGTNGKGEVSHGLFYLLKSSGKKISLWTSPHVLSLEERFKFLDKNLSLNELEKIFLENLALAKEYHLSHYEFLFYCFLKRCLRENHLDFIILEVGLGGRLDAVNILDPNLTAITSISMDHQEFLGDSLTSILREKLGIVRPGVPLLFNLEQSELRDQAQTFCKKNLVPFFDLIDLKKVSTKMDYGQRNQILAQVLNFFCQTKVSNLSLQDFVSQKIDFPVTKGRREVFIKGDLRFIFIGAHNLDGIKKMLDFFGQEQNYAESLPFSSCILAFSKKEMKNIFEMLSLLRQNSSLFNKMLITNFDHPRAMHFLEKDFASFDDKKSFHFIDDFKNELRQNILRKESNGSILVTGSYYFIGEVQKWLYQLDEDIFEENEN